MSDELTTLEKAQQLVQKFEAICDNHDETHEYAYEYDRAMMYAYVAQVEALAQIAEVLTMIAAAIHFDIVKPKVNDDTGSRAGNH